MKKTITLLLTLCLFAALFTGMAFAAGDGEGEPAGAITGAVSGAVSDVSSVFQSGFYAAPNEDARLASRVNVTLDLGGSTGTLYLPGKVDAAQLCFSWDDADLTVSRGGVEYASGTAPVAMPGESVTYKVTKGLAFALVTVKTVQGSADVEPLFLELDESLGTIEDMNGDKDHETSCYGKAVFDKIDKAVSIKGRGNSTWKFPKRAYNITFYKKTDYAKKDKTEMIPGVKAKKWSLLANYIDNSLLRNKVALDLAKAMGIGLDSRFVDVWMNGEYLGNYLMTPKNDYQAPDGGYVLESDQFLEEGEYADPQFKLPDVYEIGPVINDEGFYNRITVKDIGDDAAAAGEDVTTIEAYFNKAWAALRDYDSEDYQNYFDMDSWAKLFLMYEVSKTYDCYAGSMLMHRDGLTDSDKLIAGPAWDYDCSFGRTLRKFLVGCEEYGQLTAEGWFNDSIGLLVTTKPVSLLQELGKHASFMQHVAAIYNEYLPAFNAITADVDAQQALIRESALMNNVKWGTQSLSLYYLISPTAMHLLGTGEYALDYHVTVDWDAYVYNLREFATKRVMWLTDHLCMETPAGAIEQLDSGELQAVLTAGSDNASYQWQRSRDGETWTDIDGATRATCKPTAPVAGETYIRCVVQNAGPTITTVHGGSVPICAETVLDPVLVNIEVESPDPGKYPDVNYDCYTYLGDSMSWGFGLDPDVDNHDAHNVGVRVEGSFTDLVADVIEQNNPDAEIHPVTSSGARFCDFRIALERGMGVENPYTREDDWYGNRYPERRARLIAMDQEICRWLQASDLVTFQCGLNDVLATLINSAISTGLVDLDQITEISLEDPATIMDYLKTVVGNLAKDPDALGNLTRTFTSELKELRENGREVVKDIVALTPDDADILIVGYPKVVQSFRVIPDSDFSILFDLLDDVVVSFNDYLETLASEYDNVCYVDAPDATTFFPEGSTLSYVLEHISTALQGVHPDAAGHAYIAGCVLDKLEALNSVCRHEHTKNVIETVNLGLGVEYVSREICTDCGEVVSSSKVTTPAGDLPVPQLTIQSIMNDLRGAITRTVTRLTANLIANLLK